MHQYPNIDQVVFCTLAFEAIHCWENCDIPEVDFLKVPHRHMFHVKAYKAVSHDDRDVEFILLKRRIASYIETKYPKNQLGYINLGSMSCEMIAMDLINQFELCQCEVNEDNENGAILTVKNRGEQ